MPPEYFHNRLTFGEADDFLGGLNARYVHGYNQARMVHSIIGHLFAKNYTEPEFPWEKEKKADAHLPTKEELEKLQADAMAWEAQLNDTMLNQRTKGT